MNHTIDTTAQEVPFTPGPWRINGATVIWSPTSKAVVAAVSALRETDTVKYTEVRGSTPGFHESCGNAELITAAVNSYTKHCGSNAVAMAEADLLGEALAALRMLVAAFDQKETMKVVSLMIASEAARAVLAKAKGAA